jgi:hypothetical protein
LLLDFIDEAIEPIIGLERARALGLVVHAII